MSDFGTCNNIKWGNYFQIDLEIASAVNARFIFHSTRYSTVNKMWNLIKKDDYIMSNIIVTISNKVYNVSSA